MPVHTTPLNPANYTTRESQATLLTDAFASGDDGYIADAFCIVARAHGIVETGDPDYSTVLGVLRALGLRMRLEPIEGPDQP